MNTPEAERDSGNLKPRTVAIVFSLVALAWVVACISAGAWPMALGLPIALLLLPVLLYLLNLVGGVVIGIPLFLLSRLFPKRFRTLAAERKLHPITVFLIFLTFAGILLLIFKDIGGVIAGLLIAGFLIGLPMLAEWSRNRKTKKTANPTSEGIRQPADGSPKPSM